MDARNANLVDQAFAQIFSETRGVGGRHVEIFIEMKQFHVFPVEIGFLRQFREKLKLRCAGSSDNASAAALNNGLPDRGRCSSSRSFRQTVFVREHDQLQRSPRIATAGGISRSPFSHHGNYDSDRWS